MSNTRKHWHCTIDGCNKPHRAMGYCAHHYGSLRNHGDPLAASIRPPFVKRLCTVNGCSKPMRSDKLCKAHYAKWFYGQPVQKIRRKISLRVYYWWPKNKEKALIRSRRHDVVVYRRVYQRSYTKRPRERWRMRANWAVMVAIKYGRLVRMSCEQCQKLGQAHHDSYLKDDWLKVRWLCSEHHAQWHRRNEPTYPKEIESVGL